MTYFSPVVALVCGIVILVRPSWCPVIVGVYLVVFGILQLAGR